MSHLCFGSYATIIRKYYLGTDKDVVDDLFSSIKEGTDIDKSKVSLLINSKDNVQGYIIETSQSQRVLTSIGDYFSDYIIPNLKSKNISILKIHTFFKNYHFSPFSIHLQCITIVIINQGLFFIVETIVYIFL